MAAPLFENPRAFADALSPGRPYRGLQQQQQQYEQSLGTADSSSGVALTLRPDSAHASHDLSLDSSRNPLSTPKKKQRCVPMCCLRLLACNALLSVCRLYPGVWLAPVFACDGSLGMLVACVLALRMCAANLR